MMNVTEKENHVNTRSDSGKRRENLGSCSAGPKKGIVFHSTRALSLPTHSLEEDEKTSTTGKCEREEEEEPSSVYE